MNLEDQIAEQVYETQTSDAVASADWAAKAIMGLLRQGQTVTTGLTGPHSVAITLNEPGVYAVVRLAGA